jgi:hypothetical protein
MLVYSTDLSGRVNTLLRDANASQNFIQQYSNYMGVYLVQISDGLSTGIKQLWSDQKGACRGQHDPVSLRQHYLAPQLSSGNMPIHFDR